MLITKLQQHTINIYKLSGKSYEVKSVPARSLLSPLRFDLFAKLFYIKNIDMNPSFAKEVYINHIKAFNPDLKEPGRGDKCSIEDFISVFDGLIKTFKTNNFDDAISIIPVDYNNIILDGAHRVAALAYYDRYVTIARFKDVVSNGPFDFNYFKFRGLSWKLLDTVALEMTRWLNSLSAALFLNPNKNIFNHLFNNMYFSKLMHTNTASVCRLLPHINNNKLSHANIVDDIKSKGIKIIAFCLYEQGNLSKMAKMAGNFYEINDEPKIISALFLDDKCSREWNKSLRLFDFISEKMFRLKNIHFINLKIKVFSIINSLFR